MTRPWIPSAAAGIDSPDAGLAALEPGPAQEWCNFVLFVPGQLPAGTACLGGSLRKECPVGRGGFAQAGRSPWSPANPSAYRLEIGGATRRLRLKSFLYDWAPAAADQPCLWGNETTAVPLDDRYVVWLGRDYQGRRGAYARLARTSVELSVLDGSFSDEELVHLYLSLRPVSETARSSLEATRFAQLSYWARYHPPLIDVPYGLWAFRRRDGREDVVWGGTPEDLPDSPPVPLPPRLGPYGLDSVARFESGRGYLEHEAIYVAGPDRGEELRIIVQRSGEGRIQVPGNPERHPCRTTRWETASGRVAVAFVDARHGPVHAWWRDARLGVDALVLASSGTSAGPERFRGVLEEVMSEWK